MAPVKIKANSLIQFASVWKFAHYPIIISIVSVLVSSVVDRGF